MRMQALLIRERILGPQHPDTSYYIRYRGAVYADSGNFERCINLWKYALDMQQSNLDPLSPMTASSLLSFAELFSFMLQDRAKGLLGTSISFEDLMGILSKGVLEIERAVKHSGPTALDPAQLSKALSIILHLICLLEKVPCTAEQDHFKKETIYRCVCAPCLIQSALFPTNSHIRTLFMLFQWRYSVFSDFWNSSHVVKMATALYTWPSTATPRVWAAIPSASSPPSQLLPFCWNVGPMLTAVITMTTGLFARLLHLLLSEHPGS